MTLQIITLLLVIAVNILAFIAILRKNKPTDSYNRKLLAKINALEAKLESQNNTAIQLNDSVNSNITNNFSSLYSTMTSLINDFTAKTADFQEQYQKQLTDKLTTLEGSFDKIRSEMLSTLEKINKTVDEKLQTTLDNRLNSVSETLVKNMAELGGNLRDSQDRQQKQLTDKLTTLEGSFDKIRNEMLATLENIRKSNETAMDKLRAENQQKLDKINDTVNEKLQKSLDNRLSESFRTVNEQLAQVYKGLGEMKTVASGVSDLKNILANVKTRGILGEIQLSAILAEILAPEQYGEQVQVKAGSQEKVDFAVKLPGSKDGNAVYLPIDSKFPGDTYANLIKAQESGDPEQVKLRRKALETEIKRCAKSISEKYINPPETTSFALMFLPFEGLYAEVVNMGLVETLQRDFKINITGPSTMAATLNSLQMGFRTLAIQKKSSEVWEILSSAKKEFSNFESVLVKAREKLQKADKDLESLVGTRTRAINKSLSSVEQGAPAGSFAL